MGGGTSLLDLVSNFTPSYTQMLPQTADYLQRCILFHYLAGLAHSVPGCGRNELQARLVFWIQLDTPSSTQVCRG
jgi:hypothetical protein